MADNMMEAYYRAPPIARTFATAVFVSSIVTVLGILPTQLFIFHPYFIWKFPPEIWRVVTSFFITSPNLGLLFDTYFLYQYLSQLEIGNSRFSRKEDLLWYLMFVSGTILIFDAILGFSFLLFLPGLIVALCYTVTQDQRGMKASFYFITIPAQLTPYCMILINLLFPGGAMRMILQIEGWIGGKGRNQASSSSWWFNRAYHRSINGPSAGFMAD
ncbi:hypothetical protein ACO1O0_009051 [Amphichorda felina]